jgi:glycosyltransferase involved in cell wall biosynthesis
VTFAGFQRNIPEWMQAMDVVVHASDHEPFGIVIIEAMALAKPVVAGDAGGPQEIITDGVNGLLAPFGDHRALARQVLKYLDEPAFARDVGQAARRRALDFTPAKYAERFLENLYRLMGITDRMPESQATPL